MPSTLRQNLVSVGGALLGVAIAFAAQHYFLARQQGVEVKTGDFSYLLPPSAARTRPVVVAKTGCPACARAKQWLADQRVAYTLIVTDKDRVASAKILQGLDTASVPLLITPTGVVSGFDPDTWQHRLAR
jgi:glutaredoxin